MSDRGRYAPFRGWLAHLERLNKSGPLDVTDMKIEAAKKREAGETIEAWRARQMKILKLDDYRDHDRMHERETYEDYER